MSRRILSILLLVFMILPILASCSGNESTPTETTEPTSTVADSTAITDTQESETPTEEPTPTAEKTPLPSSSTLRGTKFLPPPDNQGNIGSCSAESVTYMQFTVAVAQYVNNVLGNTDWDPSSGNKNYIFSPKFTFVFSGAGTGYSYEILSDAGCLTLADSTFKKSGTASIMNDPISRSWDCAVSGQMAKALRYRLSNYKEMDFGIFNYDFKTESGKAHIEKMKDAINRGNAVSVCGWSGYWQYTSIDMNGLGKLGKVTDMAIWTGIEGGSDGNHAVALVGYDDNITCTMGGVTMKGAFLMVNSWGTWMDDGFVWIMYDALNKVSEHKELAEDGFYSDHLSFYSPTSAGEARIKIPYLSKENMQLIYTKTGEEFSVEGKSYPVYTIQDKVHSYYLGLDDNTVWLESKNDSCEWVLVPYSDYSKWNGYSFESGDIYNGDVYKDSFLICSVDKYKTIMSSCFLTPGNSNNTATGRIVATAAARLANVKNTAFMISYYDGKADSFTSSLKLRVSYSGNGDHERPGVLYRSSFVYWDTDVAVDQPNLVLEVELEAVKRESIKVTLYRSDLEGNMVSRVPQVIYNNITSTTMMDAEGTTRFDGNISDDTYSHGYLAFGYNVTADLSDGYDYENLLWGVNVTGNARGVKVLGLKLMLLDGTVLSEIKVNDEDSYMGPRESNSYIFDIGGDLKKYTTASGSTAILYNTDAEKYVNVNAATLSLSETKQKNAVWKFLENPNGTIRVFDMDEEWLFDITGKKIEEGVVVKLNKPSTTRLTQDWIIEVLDNSNFRLCLAENPSFCLAYNKTTGNLCITKDKNSPAAEWTSTSDVILDFTVKAEKSGDKVKLSGSAPDGYDGGEIAIKVTDKDGKYYSDPVSVTPKDGKYTTEIALPEGSYIFTVYYKDKICGFQYIYTVK